GSPVMAQDNQKPEGTWYVKVLFEKTMELSYLQNFTSDGRTTLLLPFGPGQNEEDTRVGCMGEYRKRPGPEAREYDFTLRCLYDQAWDSTYGEIRGILLMDKAGNKWGARFTYWDWLAGETTDWGGEGIMIAERLAIKPLR
ncbi:MAG: hypothetical protein R6V57_01010, partial [Vicinamibacterales bacterium]